MRRSLLGSVLQKQWLEMEKGKSIAVFLTHRESGNEGKEIKNVDWDDLVDDVFKEEVDQFFIESGVHSLHIRQMTSNWCISQPTTSSEQEWSSQSTFSNTTLSCCKNSESKRVKSEDHHMWKKKQEKYNDTI